MQYDVSAMLSGSCIVVKPQFFKHLTLAMLSFAEHC